MEKKNSQMLSLKNCYCILANCEWSCRSVLLVCCFVLFLILHGRDRGPRLGPSPSTHSTVSLHFSYFTESLHLICGEHFSLRYEDQHGSTDEGIKAPGRQADRRAADKDSSISLGSLCHSDFSLRPNWLASVGFGSHILV